MTPAQLPGAAPATVLAAGAFLKNRACLLQGRALHWSAPHGDLSDPAACAAMLDGLQALADMADRAAPIRAVAHDLHPDFPSTRAAQALAERLGVPAVPVQHHHAHLGVVMAEQGWSGQDRADGDVVGWALDGVGLGVDGQAWGGELLRHTPPHAASGHPATGAVPGPDAAAAAAASAAASGAALSPRFTRLAHLAPLALPGGDAAAREPWRLAAAVLHRLGRSDEIATRFGPQVGAALAQGVAGLLARGLRCPPSTGAGRWFDAAAAALGLAPLRQAEAEAAVALERAATAWLAEHPLPTPDADGPPPGLDLAPLVGALCDETDAGRGAARFHAALAAALVDAAVQAGARRLVLAGGCVHNRLLMRLVTERGQARGLGVWRPLATDCGDAGLALGQAWLAAHHVA